mgnify:FL=1
MKKQVINEAIEYSLWRKPDARKSVIRNAIKLGLTAEQIKSAANKRVDRMISKQSVGRTKAEYRKSFYSVLKTCEYNPTATSSRYNCTGIDWKAYHRPTSNGKGWVIICPDEPANNMYIEDASFVELLKRKYL